MTAAIFERFLGRWALDPQSCRFEQGAPPRAGLLEISRDGENIDIRMVTTDADGEVQDTAFSGTPDGRQTPFNGGMLADAMSIDAPSDDRLDSAAYWQGEALMRAARTLSADGTRMEIVQTVRLPDGEVLSNTATYLRSA